MVLWHWKQLVDWTEGYLDIVSHFCCMQSFPSAAMVQMLRTSREPLLSDHFFFKLIRTVQVDAPLVIPLLPGIDSSSWVKSIDKPGLK